jgi:hypothetical protein
VITVEKKVRDIAKPKTKGKSIVVAFGRFQPPTSGHQLLVDKVISTAKSLGAEYAMFSSRTNDPKKNPLTPRQKFKYLKRFFPDANFKDLNTIKNPVEMLYWLAEKGYDHVHLVGGEDRQGQYEAFKDLMSSTRRKDRLKLKSLTIVGAGKRDENATGVQGMSASKLRAAAAANDFKTFKSGMPRQANASDVKDLYQDLQRGMKTVIKEGINYTDIYRAAAERLLESDKKKRRADTPGQTGGFSKHNKIFPTPPCKMDEDLSQWFKEKWVDIGGKKDPKTGEYPPCGRSDTSKGKYPKCRPLNKVSSKTPETVGEMTPKERKRAVIQKRRVEPETQQSGKGNAPRMTSHLKSSK